MMTALIKVLLFVFHFHCVTAFRGVKDRKSKRALGSDLKSDIAKAITLAQDAMEVIYYRYQKDEILGQKMERFLYNMDENSYDLVKYQLAKKIVSDDATYLAIFGGSSVTAGHDNLYNESYPIVFERKIAPAMEAVGIKVNVRNIAQGANNCYPSNGCYESMGGFDPDFVNWEQSFNCGHSADMFELAARFALWSKNPGMVYYSQSGSMGGSKTANRSTFSVPYSYERWTPSVANKPPMRASAEDVKTFKNNFVSSYKELGATAARFAGAAYDYKKQGAPLAVSGMGLWENRKMEECASIPNAAELFPKICSLGPFFGTNGLQMFREYEASVYGRGRGASHHPTTAGHLFRGENIAWVILIPLLDALYEVQADLNSGLVDQKQLFNKYKEKHQSLFSLKTMPTPKYCPRRDKREADGSYPPYTCEDKMLCFTDYHPHYAKNLSLSELIVGETKWEYNQPDFANWKFPDETHIELRPGYSAVAGKDSGEIHFKINMGSIGRLTVVGYHYTNWYHANEYLIELNVPDNRLKDYKPDPSKWNIWVDVLMKQSMSILHNIPPGQHVLSIRSKENEKKATAGISHIMMNSDETITYD